MEADWRSKTDAIHHDDCDPIPKKLPTNSRCWEAGRCVCKGEGKALASFRTKLLKALSFAFPQGCDERADLRNGHYFMMLVGLPLAEVDDNVEPPAGHFLGAGELICLYHIAYMYFSPWRPTLQRMKVREEQPEPNVLKAVATSAWATLWEACEPCDRGYVWGIQLFTLLGRRSPIPIFSPSLVSIQKAIGRAGAFLPFWVPRRRRRGPRIARLLAWEDAIDGQNVDEGVADEEQLESEGDQVVCRSLSNCVLAPLGRCSKPKSK